MKKCEKCKFYRQYNNYDELINLCMYFCENRLPKDKCISEKGYIEKIQNEYNELKNDLLNLFNFINSDKFNYHLLAMAIKKFVILYINMEKIKKIVNKKLSNI